MTTPVDLWGEISPVQIRTPVAILKEQAALLGAKTNRLVEAVVDTTAIGNGTFEHSFSLVAPALDNYRYRLLTIRHGVELYPINVPGRVEPDPQTEEEFLDWLRGKLSAANTKKIIGALLAQVNS